MQFSHAVGYRGLCQVKAGDDEGFSTLLCTGGNIQLSQDPIMSTGVWGAGYANIAPISYAFNYLALEGSANFELTTKSQWGEAESPVWGTLRKFGFTDRASDQNEIHMLPDGTNGFKGHGWCTQLGFDASEGAAVTGNFAFKGDPSTDAGNGIITNSNVTTLGLEDPQLKYGAEYVEGQKTPPQVSDLVGSTLVPYWQTTIFAQATTGSGDAPGVDQLPDIRSGDNVIPDVINWSCSYNSDLQFLKCCKYQPTPPVAADYALLGEMSCDGSFTVFALRESNMGGFNSANYHETKQYLTFAIGATNYIVIPFALIQSGSTSMTTGAQYITSEFNFTGLGDGFHSIMSMETGDPIPSMDTNG